MTLITKHHSQLSGAPSTVKDASQSSSLTFTNFKDHRVKFFWIIEVASIMSFLFWLVVGVLVARLPGTLRYGHTNHLNDPLFVRNGTSIGYRENAVSRKQQLPYQLFMDVWFCLSLTAAIDALTVVFTFNGPLIRRFHYAVSQRSMVLAAVLAYIALQLYSDTPNFTREHLPLSLISGFSLYMIASYGLDKFETRRCASSNTCSHWGSLQEYSKALRISETSWKQAAILTACVGGSGFCLTAMLSPPWSALIPIIQILFESVFLLNMNAKRTPRYLILCSPPFFAAICVHWGLTPIASAPRLTVSPSVFLLLFIAGRCLHDLTLLTILRHRQELQWARREVLISNSRLISIAAVLLFMETLGISVITYIKPIMVLAFFGLSNIGFLAVASYNITIARSP